MCILVRVLVLAPVLVLVQHSNAAVVTLKRSNLLGLALCSQNHIHIFKVLSAQVQSSDLFCIKVYVCILHVFRCWRDDSEYNIFANISIFSKNFKYFGTQIEIVFDMLILWKYAKPSYKTRGIWATWKISKNIIIFSLWRLLKTLQKKDSLPLSTTTSASLWSSFTYETSQQCSLPLSFHIYLQISILCASYYKILTLSSSETSSRCLPSPSTRCSRVSPLVSKNPVQTCGPCLAPSPPTSSSSPSASGSTF